MLSGRRLATQDDSRDQLRSPFDTAVC